ncbi:MAG: hypothetical protein LAT84_00600 [Balneolia bacterium]|nr:hypothetical protein [Balneolia bacterium]
MLHILSKLLFIKLILLTGAAVLQAQDNAQPPQDNEEIILSEIKEVLSESTIITGLNQPFRLTSNMPDRSRMVIFQQLLDLGKQVRLQSDNPAWHLQLMIYSENSFRQLDSQLAERTLDSEIQLYLSDADQNLTETETIRFSYLDEVPFILREELEGDWTATRFQNTQELPVTNRWRTYGQPAIIVAATGVTVFLLFNLRSS